MNHEMQGNVESSLPREISTYVGNFLGTKFFETKYPAVGSSERLIF